MMVKLIVTHLSSIKAIYNQTPFHRSCISEILHFTIIDRDNEMLKSCELKSSLPVGHSNK